MNEPRPQITFRRLVEEDLDQLKRWLDDPDVSPWYEMDSTKFDALQREFGDAIRGDGPDYSFVIQIDERDVGYIQCYVIDHHVDYARQMEVDPGAVGIDLFIGDPTVRNRGYGATVLRKFLQQIVFGVLEASVAIIAPEPGNLRGIRAYEKADFVWLKTVPIVDADSPANTGDEYVMRLTCEEFVQELRPNDDAVTS
jgi:RimJ/RimL family protein N-acetyltransferase